MRTERNDEDRTPQREFQSASHNAILPKYLSRLLHDSFCLSGNSLIAPLVLGNTLISREAFLLMMFYQDRFAPWSSQFGNNENTVIDLENYLNSRISEHYVGFVTEVDGFILALVCCPIGFNLADEKSRGVMLGECRDIAMETIDKITDRHGIQIRCITSDFVISIGHLSDLYDKMYGMWEFSKFFQGALPSENFTIAAPTRDVMLETHRYCFDAADRLCTLIRDGGRDETIACAMGVLERLTDFEPPTLDGFRLRMQGFITNMQNALITKNVTMYSDKDHESLSNLIYPKNYREMCLSLSEWVGRLYDTYRESERDFNLTEIMKFIDHNILKPWLSVQAVSDEFQVSPSCLSTQFKLKTGQRPIDYIHGKRLEIAINLLSTTDLSVKDISVAAGYGSVATMNRAFKNYKHATPSWFKTNFKA